MVKLRLLVTFGIHKSWGSKPVSLVEFHEIELEMINAFSKTLNFPPDFYERKQEGRPMPFSDAKLLTSRSYYPSF